ncbi:MAG: hypothetical protein LH630_09045 [Actinomycetia bacterium]|nr:hypothetical protein [Actinomycetes bacterium]
MPLPQKYAAMRVDYLLGDLDADANDSSLDASCAANWQCVNWCDRGQASFRCLGTALGDSVYERQRLAVVAAVGHSAHDMFTSPVGAQTLFP